jgi:hypothetical protein
MIRYYSLILYPKSLFTVLLYINYMMDDVFMDDDDPAFDEALQSIDVDQNLFNEATTTTAFTPTLSITFTIIGLQQRP